MQFNTRKAVYLSTSDWSRRFLERVEFTGESNMYLSHVSDVRSSRENLLLNRDASGKKYMFFSIFRANSNLLHLQMQ